jgi:PAS domain S-box-containing protein
MTIRSLPYRASTGAKLAVFLGIPVLLAGATAGYVAATRSDPDRLVLWLLGAVVLTSAVGLVGLRVYVTGPLGRLARAAEAIAGEQLDTTVPRPAGDADGTRDEIATLADTVERMRSTGQRRIRRAELERDRFQSVFDGAFDAMVITNSNRKYIDVNDRAAGLFDASKNELIGTELGTFLPEDFDLEGTWQDFQRDGQTRGELSLIPDEGREVVVEYTATADITPGGHLFVFRDITERKQRQQELELLKDLQSRVLRHNLRNELTVIISNAALLDRELPAEHAEKLDQIDSAARDLQSLSEKTRQIEALLGRDLKRGTIDLDAELQEIVDRYEQREGNVSFSLDCPADSEVEAVHEIVMVFEELVENAAVHNDAPDPEVAVRVTATDAETVVTVSDNGPGIPDQEIAVRERGQETPLMHGIGIGLWLVEWITQHGDASVSYETGEDGTEVAVHIPNPGDGQ